MRASERQQRAAENLASGMPIKHAMMQAGYSEATANNGMDGVPARVLKLLAKNGGKLLEVGKLLTLKDQQDLVIGRLAINTARGLDGGTASAKVLGSRKELALFTAEIQVGVQIINAPKELITTAIIKEEE